MKTNPPLQKTLSPKRRAALARCLWLVAGCCVLLAVLSLNGSQRPAAAAAAVGATSPDGLWTFQDVQTPPNQRKATLNMMALLGLLANALSESNYQLNQSTLIATLPIPDGTFMRFRLLEASVLDPSLSLQHPEIKSYRAQGVDDPSAYARFDVTPRGFHALVLLKEKTVTIQPVSASDFTTYVTYYGQNIVSNADFQCLGAQLPPTSQLMSSETSAPGFNQMFTAVGSVRRNYRIAIATTQEYTNNGNLGGGSVSNALASINTWLNAVNAIYERDLSVHLNLVASNSNIIYTTSSDPFTNGDVTAMLGEVRTVMRDVVGTANYDVGHVLGTGNNGVAYIGVVCNGADAGDNKGPVKGGGVSLIDPNAMVGDTFFMTRIAHEIGHQFGAQHSFNDIGTYGASRAPNSAYESGTGLSLMSYAGAATTAIVASGERAPHFHGGSIGEITAYVSGSATCYTSSSTGNTPPTVNAGSDYTIPRNTPFKLTATASDNDAGDNANLTYAWEQMDAGGASYGQGSFSDAGDPSSTTRPIFRPFEPSASAARTLPSLTYILNNANVPPATIVDAYGYTIQTAENLPNVTRTLNFRATVRDGRGGASDDGVVLNVDGASGPFAVSAPNTAVSWAGGSSQTVTWSVANTNVSPVNCANVRLLLSTDGGQTFPLVLASSTPNDGSQAVTMPTGYNTTQARVKVEALNNIFFDVSNVNFTLTSGVTTCSSVTSVSPTSMYFVSGGGASSFSVTNSSTCQWTPVSSVTWITVTSSPGIGNGTVSFGVAASTGAARSGTIKLGSTTFTVNQTASTCTYTASPTSVSYTSTGGTGSISVTRSSTGCGWNAWSNASWITITSGSSGTANGTTAYTVAANTGAARTGTLTVGGVTVTISQSCGATISPASVSVAATSATGTVSVTSAGTCAWTASSNATWLTITAGASGSGNGTVSYSVAANTGCARTGTLTVAGNTFTVTQASGSGCNPVPTLTSLSPSSIKYGSAGFTLTVTGTGFVSGAVVRWKGVDRTTTFVSSTQVTAAILTADVKAKGSAAVPVFNPTPGGGLSNSLTFTITP